MMPPSCDASKLRRQQGAISQNSFPKKHSLLKLKCLKLESCARWRRAQSVATIHTAPEFAWACVSSFSCSPVKKAGLSWHAVCFCGRPRTLKVTYMRLVVVPTQSLSQSARPHSSGALIEGVSNGGDTFASRGSGHSPKNVTSTRRLSSSGWPCFTVTNGRELP